MVKAIQQLAVPELDTFDDQMMVRWAVRDATGMKEILTIDHQCAVRPRLLHAERAFKVKVGKNLLADLPRRRAGREDGGVWLLAFGDEGLRPARVVVHHDRAERVTEHPGSEEEREVHMGAANDS